MLSADQIASVSAGAIVVLAVLAPAAALLAWLLRVGRMPGGPAAAGILGGAIAGILLGATVLGKAAPDSYSALYIGGVEESRSLDEAQRNIERDLAALRAAGVSSQAIYERRERMNVKLASFVDQRNTALDQRAKAVDSAAMTLGCLLLTLGAGWAGKGRKRHLSGSAVASGFTMVVMAGAPIGIAAAWLGGFTNIQAWALGAACGIGSTWPTLRSRRFGAAGRLPETEAASFVALAIGLAAMVMATLSIHSPSTFAGAWAIVLVIVALTASAWRPRMRRPRSQRQSLRLAQGVIIPALTAVCVAPIDIPGVITTKACLIATIAALLFASDGRWFGAWLGWRLGGDPIARETAWRRSASMLAGNVGAVAIAAGALGHSAGFIGSAAMLAIVAGALFVEITTGLRHRFAIMFDAGPVNASDDADAHDS